MTIYAVSALFVKKTPINDSVVNSSLKLRTMAVYDASNADEAIGRFIAHLRQDPSLSDYSIEVWPLALEIRTEGKS